MIWVFIAASALAAQVAERDSPTGLVDRLGSNRRAEAEATLLRP